LSGKKEVVAGWNLGPGLTALIDEDMIVGFPILAGNFPCIAVLSTTQPPINPKSKLFTSITGWISEGGGAHSCRVRSEGDRDNGVSVEYTLIRVIVIW
jgi:hypothetical protein